MEIRDPIHGFIEPDIIESALLDSMPMQRLRRIKQLALACLVYPGAHHTRFEHSIGAMHVADRMARAIDLVDERRRVVRLATLLHDTGHAPFSHVGEQLLEQYGRRKGDLESSHESITLDVIRNNAIIRTVLGRRLDRVIELIEGTGSRSAERDIVSGPMDADKLDYLVRDSFFAGVKYGVADLDRIINTLDMVRAGKNESHLVISEDGAWAVAQLLLAKHHMSVQVYRHRARAITDAMIVRAVEFAIDEGVPGVHGVFSYNGSRKALDRYLRCDDDRLFRMILESPQARRSKEYCERLVSRRLFKEIFRKNIGDIPNALAIDKIIRLSREEVINLQRRIARTIGKNADRVILDVQNISNPTYRSPGFRLHEQDVMVKRRNGTIVKIQDVPDVITGPQQSTQTHINVYCEMDGTMRQARERFRRRVEKPILQILGQLGG